jgi:tetratricopeptide (TPR) repeat protein
VFATDNYGGYLIWALYPRFRPYIDTRLILRTPEEFAEYLALADEPERFDAFQRVHGFMYVVLPVVYPDRYQRLVAHLYASAQWKVIHTDGAEILFARRDGADDDGWDLGQSSTTDQILAAHRQSYGGSSRLIDAARLHLATLQILVGEFGEAERLLAECISPEAQALRARAKLAAGDLESARTIGERLLRLDENDVGTLDLLALVHARRGDHREAIALLRRVVSLNPYDSEATGLIADMEERRHDQSSIK